MTTQGKPISELNRVREWAQEIIRAGHEPPWAWYQYMKLVETVDAILEGITVTTTVNSPQSVQHQEKPHQLVETTYRQGTSRPHPVGTKVRMPM
jgi:hypothetical protein